MQQAKEEQDSIFLPLPVAEKLLWKSELLCSQLDSWIYILHLSPPLQRALNLQTSGIANPHSPHVSITRDHISYQSESRKARPVPP